MGAVPSSGAKNNFCLLSSDCSTWNEDCSSNRPGTHDFPSLPYVHMGIWHCVPETISLEEQAKYLAPGYEVLNPPWVEGCQRSLMKMKKLCDAWDLRHTFVVVVHMGVIQGFLHLFPEQNLIPRSLAFHIHCSEPAGKTLDCPVASGMKR